MNDELTKVTFTFPIHYGEPNRNRTVFTKEAIENALGSSDPNMPIVVRIDNSGLNNRVIGLTDKTYYFDWDTKNQVCRATIDGYIFNADLDIVINEMHDGEVTDFDIRAISIS